MNFKGYMPFPNKTQWSRKYVWWPRKTVEETWRRGNLMMRSSFYVDINNRVALQKEYCDPNYLAECRLRGEEP